MTLKNLLYPSISPFEKGYLKVDDTHSIYWEVSGNHNGIPIVILHGGPGGASSPIGRQFYDPKHYKIIQFDQRGCGKSTPLGELKNNTTNDLIADMERLRETLNINKWHVSGGSWGSTLGLSYAIQHPDKCSALLLRGIFMMRDCEIKWFMSGMGEFFPESYKKFKELLPKEEQDDVLNNYYKRMTTGPHEEQLKYAMSWCSYEGSCAYFSPKEQRFSTLEEKNHALTVGRMEAHYFIHNRFTPHDYILKNISNIRHIPAITIQGRYDVVCPIRSAYDLSKAWPEMQLIVVNKAGHSASEPELGKALLDAANTLKTITPSQ